MNHERIELTDTVFSSIIKLSEGNPGAIRVCSELYKKGGELDPDSFLGPLSCLLSLDTHAIYGPDIWMLFKDVCKENIVHVVAALRAVQLGLVPEATLKHAIQNYGEGFNPQEAFDLVCERLPNFKAANILEATEVV